MSSQDSLMEAPAAPANRKVSLIGVPTDVGASRLGAAMGPGVG